MRRPARLLARPLPLGERRMLSRVLAKAGIPVDDIERPGRVFWRFEAEGQVPVGYGGLDLYGGDALLHSVLTLPPARHRGVGSLIVAALETEAMVAKCRSVWIVTAIAAPFFEMLGFAPCPHGDVPAPIAAAARLSSPGDDRVGVLVKHLG